MAKPAPNPRITRSGVEDDLITATLKRPDGEPIRYTVSLSMATAPMLVTQMVLLFRNVAKGDDAVMAAVELTASAALRASKGWNVDVLIARARERYACEDPKRYWQSKPTVLDASRHAREHVFYAPKPDDPRDDVPAFALWAHRHADWKTSMQPPRVVMLRAVNGHLEAMDRTADDIDISRWEGEWCRLTPDMIPVAIPSPTEAAPTPQQLPWR